MSHPRESVLALFAGNDLSGLLRLRVGLHVVRCAECRAAVQGFQAVKPAAAAEFGRLPANFQWDRMAEEMTANIRVGLEAGECVSASTPGTFASAGQPFRDGLFSGWRQGLVYAALGALLVGGAWWLTVPSGRNSAVLETAKQGSAAVSPAGERGVVLEATGEGIELREDGRTYMTVLHPDASIKPASLTADLDGSMRARYVDRATGEVTIANVYAE